MTDVFHDRQARGLAKTGWLEAHYTFSFGSFNDPTRMGFRALRVINEDIIAGGSGFAEHAHNHFEILTFMLSGTLEHKDSAGHHGQLGAGDVQLISAGTGVKHSERNPVAEEASICSRSGCTETQTTSRRDTSFCRGRCLQQTARAWLQARRSSLACYTFAPR